MRWVETKLALAASSLAQPPRSKFSAASAPVGVAGSCAPLLYCLLCGLILFSSPYNRVQDSPLRSQISVFTMLQLQLQPLHSLSSHLVDLLGELVSLSFSSQILKPEEDPCKSNATSLQKTELHVLDTLFSSRSGQPLKPQTAPSTLTPAPPSPARRSMPSTMTPAHGAHVFFVVILEPSDESSTIKMVIFLTQTLENSRFAHNDQRSAPNNPLTATVSISDHEILISSRRNHGQPPGSREGKTEPNQQMPLPLPEMLASPSFSPPSPYDGGRELLCLLQAKRNLGFQLVGLCNSGPLSCLKSSPIIGDPNYYLLKPRSVLIYPLLNPSQVRSRFLGTFVRRLEMKQDGSLLLWLIKTSLRTLPIASPRIGYHLEVDWKKAQVDSKKILAQPHQSFKSMSFSFFPRSEISFADDLAKKAVRSMTTGLSMFL